MKDPNTNTTSNTKNYFGVRHTSSIHSAHPPNGVEWETNRQPSTLSPANSDNEWDSSISLQRSLQRHFGWFSASCVGRDGLLAASLVSNPRGDALPQFWMLQRGVVVFLALAFNACVNQALRTEPDAIQNVDLWRASTALFTLGSITALAAVGVYAWMGIAFANVPKRQFPSFVAQNGHLFRAAQLVHFLAFESALFGIITRVLAEYPFWGNNDDSSSRLVGFAALLGSLIFFYAQSALMHVFASTFCEQNGFEEQVWPGLLEHTNTTIQRHQQQEAKQTCLRSKTDWMKQMSPNDVEIWLDEIEVLQCISQFAVAECIDGLVLSEMASMSASDALGFYTTLFPSCPKGLGVHLWKHLQSQEEKKQ